MLNLLSTFFRWLQSLLRIRPERDPDTEAEAKKRPIIHVVQRLTKKAQTSLGEETSLEWGRFIKSFVSDRWQWLRVHPFTVIFFIILIGVIAFGERGEAAPWWVESFEKANAWSKQVWQDYPVSISLAGILLVLFLFGLGWFRQIDNWLLRLWQWAKSHPQISTPIGVILLILIFYIVSNANTWSFTSVEIWSEEDLKSEQIVVQFRGNLNAIGIPPLDALTLSAPSPPAAVTNAKSTLQSLSLGHCPQIMVGPKSFVALGGRSPVSLPRLSRAKAETGTAGQISLGTTLGNFSLPLQGLLRLVFSYTTFNYRELSAQIVPATRSSETGAIRIIVAALDGSRWTVEGPRENLPQLINYLVHRIALDWKTERTKQKQPTDEVAVDSADLALTLGNQAYAAGDFNAAQAYYRLAEQFRTDSATIEVMLGLTQLQLTTTITPTEKALRSFNQAINLEPNNADLYPYLACLHQQLGNEELAKQYIDDFNATLGPDSPDAKQERITKLNEKPPLGPGRRLSIFTRESDFDLYYISDDAAKFALNLSYDDPLQGDNLEFEDLTRGEAPRQVFAVADGAYYLTPDGLVNFFQSGPSSQVIPVVDADRLQYTHMPTGELALGAESTDDPNLTYSTGGIRQIFANGELLFLVDRFGRILRLRVSPTGTGGLDVTFEAVAEVDARQILLDTNALYLLKEDGTVWRISDPLTGDLQAVRQLVSDTENREITAGDGFVYMLRTNGNIWRYLDGEGIEDDLLQRIDGGGETSRIFLASQGLFVLKNSNVNWAVWLIRNPQNPIKDDFEQLNNISVANRVAINVAGSNLLALERDETKSPVVKAHPIPVSIPEQIQQMPEAPPAPTLPPPPTSTPLPTTSPTPVVASPTPSPMPTAVNTPTSTATPPPEAKIETTLVTSQTRVIDDAVEVLVQNTENQANWFWIDRTEVTNRQYQTCIDAEACTENVGGYADLFYEANHPVVGVDWAQAQDYCQWVEGNLPTVSQWRAAASPDGRVYPWGDTGPTCEVAIINDACDTEEPGTRPVGSKPEGASPFGVLDLVGNVWEWTDTPGNKDDARVTLGGSWSNPDRTPQGGFEAFNPANTLSQDEPLQASNLGFRCARVYEPASTKK